ncbi:hypothetical protein JCM10212_006742 [Sporobolomyces blumeae]
MPAPFIATEVIDDMLESVTAPADLRACCLASKALRAIARPKLYRKVQLRLFLPSTAMLQQIENDYGTTPSDLLFYSKRGLSSALLSLLAAVPHATSLHLDLHDFDPEISSLPSARLKQLHLEHFTGFGAAEMPKLRRLDLVSGMARRGSTITAGNLQFLRIGSGFDPRPNSAWLMNLTHGTMLTHLDVEEDGRAICSALFPLQGTGVRAAGLLVPELSSLQGHLEMLGSSSVLPYLQNLVFNGRVSIDALDVIVPNFARSRPGPKKIRLSEFT